MSYTCIYFPAPELAVHFIHYSFPAQGRRLSGPRDNELLSELAIEEGDDTPFTLAVQCQHS